MVNFHIPGIAAHLNVNLKLIRLIKSNPEFFYDEVNISGVYGSFYCPWNGGRTNGDNFLEKQQKEAIVQEFNDLGVGVLFTYTNTMLEERDLFDMYANEDLGIINTNSLNKIIIVSDLLKEYIQKKYPNIKFISSIASARTIQDSSEYEIRVVNANMNNTEALFNIEDKSCIEILLNSNCVRNCVHEKEHYDAISLANLSKSAKRFRCPFEADAVNDLESLMKRDMFVTVEDLYGKYKPAGFNIFKLNGRHTSDENVIDYYLYYMVKPEYKETVRELLQ